MASAMTRRVMSDPLYQQLVHQRRRLAVWLTAAMLVVYYGFILLVAFAPAKLGQKLDGSVITLGLPLGAGVILIAILLTGIYVWRANSHYDALTEQLRQAVQP